MKSTFPLLFLLCLSVKFFLFFHMFLLAADINPKLSIFSIVKSNKVQVKKRSKPQSSRVFALFMGKENFKAITTDMNERLEKKQRKVKAMALFSSEICI